MGQKLSLPALDRIRYPPPKNVTCRGRRRTPVQFGVTSMSKTTVASLLVAALSRVTSDLLNAIKLIVALDHLPSKSFVHGEPLLSIAHGQSGKEVTAQRKTNNVRQILCRTATTTSSLQTARTLTNLNRFL